MSNTCIYFMELPLIINVFIVNMSNNFEMKYEYQVYLCALSDSSQTKTIIHLFNESR